ncbi:hypothetical protein EUA66_03095 [TM7 phylum sp. oral taxon 349]|nr:hypothetical protein EUA66_03095 [TM7 phylum sp. oral taxon 349]
MRLSKSCALKRKRCAWASRFARVTVAAVVLCALSSLHAAPAVYANTANSTIQVTVYRPTPTIGTVAVTYYKVGGQRYAKVEVSIRSSNNLEYTFDMSVPQSRAVPFSNNWQTITLTIPLPDDAEHDLKLVATNAPAIGSAETTIKLKFTEAPAPTPPPSPTPQPTPPNTPNNPPNSSNIFAALARTGDSLALIVCLALSLVAAAFALLARRRQTITANNK